MMSAIRFLGLGLLLLAGCAAKTARQPWEDSLVLKNRQITLVVNPRIGRIVWFGFHDGPNRLWMNTPEGVVQDKPLERWFNWGGDKVWLGPQPRWRAQMDRLWPPDEAIDGWPWVVNQAEDRHIVMTSSISRFSHVQMVREITLDEQQPVVRMKYTLRRAENVPYPFTQPVAVGIHEPMQIWTVTQVQPPEQVLLDVQPGHAAATQPCQMLSAGDSPPLIARGRAVLAPPFKGQEIKLGTMGRWLAAVYDREIFVQSTRVEPHGNYPERSCLQLLVSKDFDELESLSPVESLPPEKPLVYQMEWRLLSRPAGMNAEQLQAVIEQTLSRRENP